MTVSKGQDTLTCLNYKEITLINKLIASEKYYRSMYDIDQKKIANLQDQLSITEEVASKYKLSFESKESQYSDMQSLYEFRTGEFNFVRENYFKEVRKKKIWKTTTIIGIPVSFVGGIILLNQIKK